MFKQLPKKMSQSRVMVCCVHKCPYTSKNSKKLFFGIPGSRFRIFQRNKWISVLRKHNGRWWQPHIHTVVCSDHFVNGKPSTDWNDVDYVPSVFNVEPPEPETPDFHVKCRSVSVKRFAMEYIKHDALLEKPCRANIDTKQRKAAYVSLSQALHIPVQTVKAWETRFRDYFEHKMLSLMRRGRTKVTQQCAPQWVRAVNARLKVLKELQLNEYRRKLRRTRSSSPGSVVNALVAAARVRGSLCSSALYHDVRQALRLHTGVSDLHAVWVQAQRVSLTQVTWAGRAGDARAAAAPSDAARVADLVLLNTDVDMHRIVTDESVSLYEESVALYLLWQLVERHHLEEQAPTASPCRALRWTKAYKEYTATGRVASIVVLQRRWHELKVQARERLAAYWHKQAPPTATTTTVATDDTASSDVTLATDATPAADAPGATPAPVIELPRPAPIHLNILKRYPYIATCPLICWRQLVLEGVIVTEPLENIEEKEEESEESTNNSSSDKDGELGDLVIDESSKTISSEDELTHKKCTNTLEVLHKIDPEKVHTEIMFDSETDDAESSYEDDTGTKRGNTNDNELNSKEDKDGSGSKSGNSNDNELNSKDDKNKHRLKASEANDTAPNDEGSKGGNEVASGSDEEMNELDDIDGNESNIDSKLLLESRVSLIKLEETVPWKKHARRNKTINIAKINNVELLAPKPINKCNKNIKRELSLKDKEEIPSKIAKIVVTDDASEHDSLLVIKNQSKEKVINTHPVEDTTDSSEDEALINLKVTKQKDNRINPKDTKTSVTESESDATEDEFTNSSDEEFFLSEKDRTRDLKRKYKDYRAEKKELLKASCRTAASTLEWNIKFDPVFGDKTRVAKKVELPNIEEVRRVNSGILTAQVAPITAQAQHTQPFRVYLDSEGIVNMVDENDGMPSEAQLRTVLEELSVTATRTAQQVMDVPHCCAARRHRVVNDARRCIGLPEIPLHNHAAEACTCCCAHLCDANVRARLNAQLRALHTDIASMFKASSDKLKPTKRKKRKADTASKAKSSGVKFTTEISTSTGKPPSNDKLALNDTQTSTAKTSIKPDSAATLTSEVKLISEATPTLTSLSDPQVSLKLNEASSEKICTSKQPVAVTKATTTRSILKKNDTSGKPSKSAKASNSTIAPSTSSVIATTDATSIDNGYNEWLRQKSLNAQYFHITPIKVKEKTKEPLNQTVTTKSTKTTNEKSPNDTQKEDGKANFFTSLDIQTISNMNIPENNIAPTFPVQLNNNTASPLNNQVITISAVNSLQTNMLPVPKLTLQVNNNNIRPMNCKPNAALPQALKNDDKIQTMDTLKTGEVPKKSIVMAQAPPKIVRIAPKPIKNEVVVTNTAPITPEVTAELSSLPTQIKPDTNQPKDDVPNIENNAQTSHTNYPKIKLVPFENLADTSKKSMPNFIIPPTRIAENSMNKGKSLLKTRRILVPINMKGAVAQNSDKPATITPINNKNLSVLEQISRSLSPGQSLRDGLKAMTVQIPGPQGPQTTIIMAVTLPPDNAQNTATSKIPLVKTQQPAIRPKKAAVISKKRIEVPDKPVLITKIRPIAPKKPASVRVKPIVISNLPVTTVDLTSDSENNDVVENKSGLDNIEITNVTSEVFEDLPNVVNETSEELEASTSTVNQTLESDPAIDSVASASEMGDGSQVTLLNARLRDLATNTDDTMCEGDNVEELAMSPNEEDVYLYKPDALHMSAAQLPAGSTLLCIDGSRCPLLVREPAPLAGSLGYLLLTDARLPRPSPTLWTLTSYSGVARVVTPPPLPPLSAHCQSRVSAVSPGDAASDAVVLQQNESGVTGRVPLEDAPHHSMGRGLAMPVTVTCCNYPLGNHNFKILTAITSMDEARNLVADEASLYLLNIRTGRIYPLSVEYQDGGLAMQAGYKVEGDVTPRHILGEVEAVLNDLYLG